MSSEKNKLLRWLAVIAVALAVPILPFLAFGNWADAKAVAWLDALTTPGAAAAFVVGLLAADVFLPVPSSVVCTFSGKMLGFWGGTAASWCGMTVGVVIAFWLVRLFGRPLARRFSSDKELARMDSLADRYGVLILILARPVPVFAEASVLLMATLRIGWLPFLTSVSVSNLVIAAVYAAFGDQTSLPIAIAASMAIPAAGMLIARRFWPTVEPHHISSDEKE